MQGAQALHHHWHFKHSHCRRSADVLIRQGIPASAGINLHSGNEGALSGAPEAWVSPHEEVAIVIPSIVPPDGLRMRAS